MIEIKSYEVLEVNHPKGSLIVSFSVEENPHLVGVKLISETMAIKDRLFEIVGLEKFIQELVEPKGSMYSVLLKEKTNTNE